MADARLKFLSASARYYAVAAPATAAHLMLQHAQMAEEAGLPHGKDHPPDICRACGTLAVAEKIPDTSASESEIAPQQLRALVTLPSPKLIASPSGVDMLETKCAACHRITRNTAARLGAAGRNDLRKEQANTAASHQSGGMASEDTPNKGTKQRPKARKRGGLQAIVERSRVSRDTSLTSGLDLMDLMKAG